MRVTIDAKTDNSQGDVLAWLGENVDESGLRIEYVSFEEVPFTDLEADANAES